MAPNNSSRNTRSKAKVANQKNGTSSRDATSSISSIRTDTESEHSLDLFRRVHVRNQTIQKPQESVKATKSKKMAEKLSISGWKPRGPGETSVNLRKETKSPLLAPTNTGTVSSSLHKTKAPTDPATTRWYCGHCHSGPMHELLDSACHLCFRRRDSLSYSQRLGRLR